MYSIESNGIKNFIELVFIIKERIFFPKRNPTNYEKIAGLIFKVYFSNPRTSRTFAKTPSAITEAFAAPFFNKASTSSRLFM